ncbi:unnamed protein product [Bursaphelenchus xylophilus]|uniref:(pine wood nematode) hypothetical protein n=1 Tax=Bursaphelenchus xylophilus TaxID=6326 RepID=A0A1I7SCW4_BURXY|nr:unnamed protein product [Bursaphelenchus xylophilus]CAG9093358.1 unnamed protein product [Bursaphelenchus xylophilus]
MQFKVFVVLALLFGVAFALPTEVKPMEVKLTEVQSAGEVLGPAGLCKQWVAPCHQWCWQHNYKRGVCRNRQCWCQTV